MQTTAADSRQQPGRLSLLVRQIRFEAIGINSYELVHPAGEVLPPFAAGAHIDVHLNNGVIRQYSLANAQHERHRYVIGVLRDEKGRGGSKALHDGLRVQDIVEVSYPRNNFMLTDKANKVILLAGGIGVTPIKAMAHALDDAGIPFEFHYCARNQGCVAFGDTLAGPWKHGTTHFHFDHGNPADGLDIAGLLRHRAEGAHLYYCGPSGFMQACAAASVHWPAGTVHFEHFKASQTQAATADAPAGSFALKIASTGAMIQVGPATSIADALKTAGVRIETSCESGLCGTCRIRYLEGEVDHHDCILDDAEQRQFLTACVSRAKTPILVLDL